MESADDAAHARPGDDVHRHVMLFQPFNDADVRDPTRSAAAQDQSYLEPFPRRRIRGIHRLGAYLRREEEEKDRDNTEFLLIVLAKQDRFPFVPVISR